MTKIECKLCIGDRLVEVSLAVAVAEDFRGPQNLSTAAVHYGYLIQVTKIECKLYIGDRLVEVSLAVAVAVDFRGPQNLSTGDQNTLLY